MSSKVVERIHTGHEILVELNRLSAYLDLGRAVDLLKVDVEGAELEVLLGLDVAHWPLVGQVLMEVQDLGGRLTAVCDLLREYGLIPTARLAPMADPDIGNYVRTRDPLNICDYQCTGRPTVSRRSSDFVVRLTTRKPCWTREVNPAVAHQGRRWRAR